MIMMGTVFSIVTSLSVIVYGVTCAGPSTAAMTSKSAPLPRMAASCVTTTQNPLRSLLAASLRARTRARRSGPREACLDTKVAGAVAAELRHAPRHRQCVRSPAAKHQHGTHRGSDRPGYDRETAEEPKVLKAHEERMIDRKGNAMTRRPSVIRAERAGRSSSEAGTPRQSRPLQQGRHLKKHEAKGGADEGREVPRLSGVSLGRPERERDVTLEDRQHPKSTRPDIGENRHPRRPQPEVATAHVTQQERREPQAEKGRQPEVRIAERDACQDSRSSTHRSPAFVSPRRARVTRSPARSRARPRSCSPPTTDCARGSQLHSRRVHYRLAPMTPSAAEPSGQSRGACRR